MLLMAGLLHLVHQGGACPGGHITPSSLYKMLQPTVRHSLPFSAQFCIHFLLLILVPSKTIRYRDAVSILHLLVKSYFFVFLCTLKYEVLRLIERSCVARDYMKAVVTMLDITVSDADLRCRTVPVGPDQLLLRGAMLRNTHWIFGISCLLLR